MATPSTIHCQRRRGAPYVRFERPERLRRTAPPRSNETLCKHGYWLKSMASTERPFVFHLTRADEVLVYEEDILLGITACIGRVSSHFHKSRSMPYLSRFSVCHSFEVTRSLGTYVKQFFRKSLQRPSASATDMASWTRRF